MFVWQCDWHWLIGSAPQDQWQQCWRCTRDSVHWKAGANAPPSTCVLRHPGGADQTSLHIMCGNLPPAQCPGRAVPFVLRQIFSWQKAKAPKCDWIHQVLPGLNFDELKLSQPMPQHLGLASIDLCNAGLALPISHAKIGSIKHQQQPLPVFFKCVFGLMQHAFLAWVSSHLSNFCLRVLSQPSFSAQGGRMNVGTNPAQVGPYDVS